jgi:hypothetical protein
LLAILTRVASGHVLFGTMAKGQVVTGQDIYAYNIDPAFDWQNNATNRFTVVGRGNRFFLYTNGTFIGEIDPSAPPEMPPLPPEPEKPIDIECGSDSGPLHKKAEREGGQIR